MYVCDGSVWLALALAGHIHHTVARRWLDGIDEPDSVLFCRATQQTLLRLLTNAALITPYHTAPLTNAEAWAAYDELAADERIAFQADEPLGLERRWRTFTRRDVASSKLWMDAYLAAFASAGGWQMVTTDRVYRQFDGVELVLLS